MLPSPISAGRTRTFYSHSRRSTNITDILLTRSRLTNLGLVFLSCATFISLLLNIYQYSSTPPHQQYHLDISSHHPFDDDPSQTVSRETWMASLDHLIIVPGHAIWKGTDPTKRIHDGEWILEEYQKGGARVQAFWDHIAAGAELALEDEHSLLVFSGGQTRVGSMSTEAASYLRLALASNLFPPSSSSSQIFPRTTTEDYALDSYQNLLFSVARFHEFTGTYPKYITIVGYEMKRRRFEELHSKALRWPKGRLAYIGMDANAKEMESGKQGELTNAYFPYKNDIYGCHTSLLSKRASRNPFARFHPYWASAKELRGLLSWCPDSDTSYHSGSWWSNLFGFSPVRSSRDEDGPGKEDGWSLIYPGRLPWD